MAVIRPAMAQLFVRPSVMYVSYQNSGYSDKTGLSLAAGSTLGANNEHELSLEIASMNWALTQNEGAGQFVFTTKGSGQIVPYLANYRYRFSTKNAQLRVFLGLSLGLANSRGDLTQYRSGAAPHASFSKWLTAYGGGFGAGLKLTDALELEIGYRYLQIASTDVGAGIDRLPMERTKAHLLSVGLGFRF